MSAQKIRSAPPSLAVQAIHGESLGDIGGPVMAGRLRKIDPFAQAGPVQSVQENSRLAARLVFPKEPESSRSVGDEARRKNRPGG